MSPTSRREFLKLSVAAGAAVAVLRTPDALLADALGLPIGLQLYSLREFLPKDFEGTLRQIASAGYQVVEAAGFYDRSASEFKQAMSTAGLRCVSAHYPLSQLQPKLDSIIAYAKELGVQYMVCASPSLQDPARVKLSPQDPGYHAAWMQAFMIPWLSRPIK